MANVRAIGALFKEAAFDGRANGLRISRRPCEDTIDRFGKAIFKKRPILRVLAGAVGYMRMLGGTVIMLRVYA